MKKIAFLAYESRFAPCGGIAAVMNHLPEKLERASGLDVFILTPLHHEIEKVDGRIRKARKAGKLIRQAKGKKLKVRFRDRDLAIEAELYVDAAGIQWCFLASSDPRFFAGYPNPYRVGGTQESIAANLRRDALIFGAAAAKWLDADGRRQDWILLMQDWETSTVALALAGSERKPRMFLTLHNSYDSGHVTRGLLEETGIDPEKCRGPEEESTVVERVCGLAPGAPSLIERQIFTVSDQFALDFSQDVLQSRIMAPHLQQLEDRITGVDNGPFSPFEVPQRPYRHAVRGDFGPLAKWKSERKAAAVKALENHRENEEKPVWGDLRRFLRDDAPWFVFSGRDDTRQKGYDVAVAAISGLLARWATEEEPATAKFLFFPMPGDEGKEGLEFLADFARAHPEHVLAMPFRWVAGYFPALRGAAFGVMPSLYEPFGMANEFYLNGTVGIGRATGGLLQQIVPFKALPCFSSAVKRRTADLHLFSARPTGLLYRERDDLPSAEADWTKINEAGYDVGGSNHRVAERRRYRVFREMALELELAIADGLHLYLERTEIYYQMLTEGIQHIRRSFSWERAAQEYRRGIL